MNPMRATLMIVAATALTACAGGDLVSRNALPGGPLLSETASGEQVVVARDYRVTDVEVVVPETLSVSEDNSYFPRADIVWREDPMGDRYQQVDALITKAIETGVQGFDGARDVKLQLVLSRFHALTEKTRFGAPQGSATHDIKMTLTVLDASTGEVIEPARPFDIEFSAHTSGTALADLAQGITQRSRITETLADLIKNDLS